MLGYLESLTKDVGVISIVSSGLFIAVNHFLLLTIHSIVKVKYTLRVFAVSLIRFGYATGIGITYLISDTGKIAGYRLIAVTRYGFSS